MLQAFLVVGRRLIELSGGLGLEACLEGIGCLLSLALGAARGDADNEQRGQKKASEQVRSRGSVGL